jgi:hypothetical protein
MVSSSPGVAMLALRDAADLATIGMFFEFLIFLFLEARRR